MTKRSTKHHQPLFNRKFLYALLIILPLLILLLSRLGPQPETVVSAPASVEQAH